MFHNVNQKVGLVMKLSGPKVTDEKLAEAFRALQDRHPLLRMVLGEFGI